MKIQNSRTFLSLNISVGLSSADHEKKPVVPIAIVIRQSNSKPKFHRSMPMHKRNAELIHPH